MGAPRKPLTPPAKDADPREKAQHAFLSGLVPFLDLNRITNIELADLVNMEKTGVDAWFIRGNKRRLPTIPTLIDIVNIKWPDKYISYGMHGRPFNYVRMMEGKPFTDLEEKLLIENENLKNELKKLKGE